MCRIVTNKANVSKANKLVIVEFCIGGRIFGEHQIFQTKA